MLFFVTFVCFGLFIFYYVYCKGNLHALLSLHRNMSKIYLVSMPIFTPLYQQDKRWHLHMQSIQLSYWLQYIFLSANLFSQSNYVLNVVQAWEHAVAFPKNLEIWEIRLPSSDQTSEISRHIFHKYLLMPNLCQAQL